VIKGMSLCSASAFITFTNRFSSRTPVWMRYTCNRSQSGMVTSGLVHMCQSIDTLLWQLRRQNRRISPAAVRIA
jgi:hypothetical protein